MSSGLTIPKYPAKAEIAGNRFADFAALKRWLEGRWRKMVPAKDGTPTYPFRAWISAQRVVWMDNQGYYHVGGGLPEGWANPYWTIAIESHGLSYTSVWGGEE